MALTDLWPILTTGLLGAVGYGELRQKVTSNELTSKERYETLQRAVDKIDQRQEDLIDLLLRERGHDVKR